MDRHKTLRPENTTLGITLIVGSVFLMTLADALVKLVSADITLWQIYVTRSLISIPVLAVIMLWRGSGLWPKAAGWAYLRAALLVLMWIAYYASLPLLSLSVAAVALYTSPLLIALLSARLIGEPVGPRRWIALLIGFVGVLTILQPGTGSFSWFTLLPILGAVFYALAMILTRSKCLDETPLTLALALNVSLMAAGSVMTGVLWVLDLTPRASSTYPFVLGPWAGMGVREWGVVSLLGVLIAVYSAGVAKAYQSAAPSIVGTFDYAYLVFAALWGFVIFAETPDAATLIGMILIAASGILVARPLETARHYLAGQPSDQP
jgi:drug/metabolite transporter (DMT)-like permease